MLPNSETVDNSEEFSSGKSERGRCAESGWREDLRSFRGVSMKDIEMRKKFESEKRSECYSGSLVGKI